MKVAVGINGRTVVASGTLTLAGGDSIATVKIEDIEYIFEFIIFEAQATLTASNPHPKAMKLIVCGAPDVPTQWWFPEAGTINGRRISLAFVASTFRGNTEHLPGVLLHYTFSASPLLSGLLS